jgi:endonuclease/exonuclease/phosphatase family metal-dependent hydrolase
MSMKKLIFLFLLVVTAVPAIQSQHLNIATYNLRNKNEGDSLQGNGWSKRCPVICELVRFHDFDLWGAQEVLHSQLMDLLKGLNEYNYAGVGRDDGKMQGEYAPIFYRKDRFTCLKSGHFWLSPVTDKPNKGLDAALPRICTWIRLQETGTNRIFWFFNLHLDHIGIVARKESVKLVLGKINEMCGNEPVILAGDFNVDQHNESYALVQTSGRLTDTFGAAKIRYALTGTFNDFNPNEHSDSRIDHLFVSSGFDVIRYGILTDSYRDSTSIRFPSDHFPVKAEIKILPPATCYREKK